MTIQSEIDDTVRLCLRNRHRMALKGTAELSWYAGERTYLIFEARN
jgi:hypothetical protein